MAMNFYHRDETSDNGLSLPQNNSNLYQNPLNDNGLVSSHQLNQQLLQQNDHLSIPQRNHHPSNIGLTGQLGLGQIMTEVRRTYVIPNRVQVHSFIRNLPMQNQLAFPPNEVIDISEVKNTTRFLAPTSTMDRLLAPNHSIPTQNLLQNNCASIQGLIANNRVGIQGQLPNFRNQFLISTNSVNRQLAEIDPFLNPHHQNLSLNLRTPRIVELDHRDEANGGEVLDPKQLSACPSLIAKGKNPGHDNDENPRQNPNPNHNQLKINNIQNPNAGESIGNDQNAEYDGRTHSLLCKKYGHYQCPKCKGMFYKSQIFAAHIWSHYKYETSAERKRRLAATYKKRNLRLIHSSEGLKIMPQPSNEQVNVKAKTGVEVEDEVQKQGSVVHSANVETSNGGMKEIKEEIVEGNFVGEVEIK